MGAAAVRRVFFAPPHLQQTLDAVLILLLIPALMVSFLLGQGFLGISQGPSGWSPIGSLLAALPSAWPALAGSSRELYALMWWVHMAVVLGFLAYLPYSKHLHLLASPFNVFFGSLRPAGDLGASGAGEELVGGSSRWEELTWRQLLNGLACAECGRCDRACPALSSGYALSPRTIVHQVKEHLLEAGWEARKDGASAGDGARPLIGGLVSEAELWACATCLACMERCPVLNEHFALIVQMRRSLVGQGSLDRTLQETLTRMGRYGNSFGQSYRVRARWTQGLAFKVKDARKEPVEYLWFVGDYASYDPRVQEATRATARIFQGAGLDFGILYEGERSAGNDVRRVGEEGLFEMLREKNLRALEKAGFQAIVTTDPHTYNTLKNEYPVEAEGVPVWHSSELLNRLILQGKLPLKRGLNARVTYHDPCYLGRYNGIYEAPRRVLRALGIQLVEMPRSRSRSYCCGAGGGRIWMEEPPGVQERPAQNRIREALSLPDVQVFAIACPKEMAMFGDAVATTDNEGKIAVKDLSQLVWEAMEEEEG